MDGQINLNPPSETAVGSTAFALDTSATATQVNLLAASDDTHVQAAEQADGPVSGWQNHWLLCIATGLLSYGFAKGNLFVHEQ